MKERERASRFVHESEREREREREREVKSILGSSSPLTTIRQSTALALCKTECTIASGVPPLSSLPSSSLPSSSSSVGDVDRLNAPLPSVQQE